jgi:hypothetical protein
VEVEGEGVLRTSGEPLTMRQMREDYGPELDEAAAHFDVPVEWIMAMVTIEAVRIKGTRTWDPRSYRYESRIDDASVGLMQTLIGTARDMQRRYDLYQGERIDRAFLEVPLHSLMLGTAYMRYQLDRYDDEWGQDPVILTGTYNAGSLRLDKPNKDGKLNPFMVRTYGPERTHKFLRFLGDAVAVMREERGDELREDTIHASGSAIGRLMRWLFGGGR